MTISTTREIYKPVLTNLFQIGSVYDVRNEQTIFQIGGIIVLIDVSATGFE